MALLFSHLTFTDVTSHVHHKFPISLLLYIAAKISVTECMYVICLPTEHQGAQRTRSNVAVHSDIELEFGNVRFLGEGNTGVPGEKLLGAEKETNNKLNPHMTPGPEMKPGTHW